MKTKDKLNKIKSVCLNRISAHEDVIAQLEWGGAYGMTLEREHIQVDIYEEILEIINE